MSYVQRLITANESILLRARRHFFVLFGEVFRELLILIVLAIGWVALRKWNPDQIMFFEIALGVIAVIALGSILFDLIAWRSDEFFVTTRRVIHATGVLNKKVLDSSLSKINDVILEQSFLGRLFGYGTIKILTATEEVINRLEQISNPVAFKHAMLEAKAQLEPMVQPPMAVQPLAQTASASQLLEELADLKTRNMITEDEYQEKRKEILKRI